MYAEQSYSPAIRYINLLQYFDKGTDVCIKTALSELVIDSSYYVLIYDDGTLYPLTIQEFYQYCTLDVEKIYSYEYIQYIHMYSNDREYLDYSILCLSVCTII